MVSKGEPTMGKESEDPRQGTDTEQTRISIRLSAEARAALDEVVRLGGMGSLQEAVRRAIGDERFLLKERQDGWRILLQKDDKIREVVWPNL
jgi:Arc/MetJ-type ribon-helix-helix transcriptional regulator